MSAWLKGKLDKTAQSILDERSVVSAWSKCKCDKSAQADQLPEYKALMLSMKSCSMLVGHSMTMHQCMPDAALACMLAQETIFACLQCCDSFNCRAPQPVTAQP